MKDDDDSDVDNTIVGDWMGMKEGIPGNLPGLRGTRLGLSTTPGDDRYAPASGPPTPHSRRGRPTSRGHMGTRTRPEGSPMDKPKNHHIS